MEVPEAPKELVVSVAQQEAPEEPNVEDKVGDHPPVTYKLDQF